MSNYSLEIYDSSGRLYASPATQFFNLEAKVDTYLPKDDINGFKFNTGISAEAIAPFVRPHSSASVVCVNMWKEGNTWMMHLFVSAACNVTFYIFTTDIKSKEGYGLELYGEKGNLVFSSSTIPLEIKHYNFSANEIELGYQAAFMPCACGGAKGSSTINGASVSGTKISHKAMSFLRRYYIYKYPGAFEPQSFGGYAAINTALYP